jgi:O-antigen/teichoic acid export membrane protein
MLKLLLLAMILFTPSVFASTACMDCGRPSPATIFIFSNIISVVILIAYFKIFSLCLNTYFRTNSIMLKLSAILGILLCSVITYFFCIEMNGIFFCIVIMTYTLLMLKQLKNINDKKDADDRISKKTAIKILLIFLIMCIYIPNCIQNEMIKIDNDSNYHYEI